MIDKIYQEELFKKLSKASNLKKVETLCKQLFGKVIFWVVEGTRIKEISPLNANSICQSLKDNKKRRCLECITKTIKRVEKSRTLEQFSCPGKRFGLCLPLVQGDAFYGSLIFCHLKNIPSRESLCMLTVLNNTVLEKAQKELELSKLYQTIRPRAIALSTIHTIRRLISSSLNPDELLPRIARLSLQVLRAKQCLISLVDKKTERLVPKAVVDLSKKGTKWCLPHAFRRIEKKVMRSGNILLKKSCLSVPLIDEELIGIITVSQKMANRPFDHFDREILTALSEQAVGAIKNAQLYKEQENMLLGTVKSLSTLLKVKAAYPYIHSRAFVEIALGIAGELKVSEDELRNLRFAAMLHGTEKIGIPEEILKKPTRLSGKEYKIVREYPKKSVKILSPLERLKPAIAIILHHHEKFDGSGYPDRLKGEKIPLGARIMAVADSFEAMLTRRPYRKSTSIAHAIRELKKYSGTQFDPQVIKAFLKLVKRKSFRKLLRDAYYGRSKKSL
ncbi:MAG: HD domain-containing protein [Candidatus Omnitrophica bacterium]|nr:HD domain-containing protein [Candidatus Omnitrophota bacterium]